MYKRQPYGSFDFMGADTYGWPLPARMSPPVQQSRVSLPPAPSPPARALVTELSSAENPTPDIPATEPLKMPQVSAASNERDEPSPLSEPHFTPQEQTESIINSESFSEAQKPPSPPKTPLSGTEAPPLTQQEPPTLPDNDDLRESGAVERSVFSDSDETEANDDANAWNENTMWRTQPQPPTFDTRPRVPSPSIFEGISRLDDAPDGYWPARSWESQRQATPTPVLQDEPDAQPDDSYPPIVVDRPSEMSSRQILRLYAGEKSAMTLAHTYFYNSICFEEDCPKLSPTMERLALDAAFFAQLLGKLALAFGADPRPRVMQQSLRGQFWSGSFVNCTRDPRQAIVELMELERGLILELRRFTSSTKDDGAKALLDRMAEDAERRVEALNHSLAQGGI